METNVKTCCVFGHRKINKKEELKVKLTQIIEDLIICEKVDTFYLGSRSEFDDLCREILSDQKEKHPHIRRIYIRAEFPDIKEDYEKYLLQSCEETYFPERLKNAGRAVYVERNYEMIDKSDFCIVYFKDGYVPGQRTNTRRNSKSGTETAYKYAVKKKRTIINLAD